MEYKLDENKLLYKLDCATGGISPSQSQIYDSPASPQVGSGQHPSDKTVLNKEDKIESHEVNGKELLDLGNGKYNLDDDEGYRFLPEGMVEFMSNAGVPVKPEGRVEVKKENDKLYIERNGERREITDGPLNEEDLFPEVYALGEEGNENEGFFGNLGTAGQTTVNYLKDVGTIALTAGIVTLGGYAGINKLYQNQTQEVVEDLKEAGASPDAANALIESGYGPKLRLFGQGPDIGNDDAVAAEIIHKHNDLAGEYLQGRIDDSRWEEGVRDLLASDPDKDNIPTGDEVMELGTDPENPNSLISKIYHNENLDITKEEVGDLLSVENAYGAGAINFAKDYLESDDKTRKLLLNAALPPENNFIEKLDNLDRAKSYTPENMQRDMYQTILENGISKDEAKVSGLFGDIGAILEKENHNPYDLSEEIFSEDNQGNIPIDENKVNLLKHGKNIGEENSEFLVKLLDVDKENFAGGRKGTFDTFNKVIDNNRYIGRLASLIDDREVDNHDLELTGAIIDNRYGVSTFLNRENGRFENFEEEFVDFSTDGGKWNLSKGKEEDVFGYAQKIFPDIYTEGKVDEWQLKRLRRIARDSGSLTTTSSSDGEDGGGSIGGGRDGGDEH